LPFLHGGSLETMLIFIPGIRFLACGGDGTAGWVLSVLDKITINPSPPVGKICPLRKSRKFLL